MTGVLGDDEVAAIDAYWRAANYLTVGQIYLRDNPLLREPLAPEHVKTRLLGHWGTSPGQNLVYAHLNRLIRAYGTDCIYISGPGHGGPAVVANVYLEGTYTEIYPQVTRDAPGLVRLFRQFSTPGGIPSHVSVPTPGSIHEGGELGYALVHAFGAAFDHPDLLVACVVGDGEAETGPLAGSWKGIDFVNAARDGAVLPILHLNGYKIASATVLGRYTDDEIRAHLGGIGYAVHVVAGDDPDWVHRELADTLDAAHHRIREIQGEARAHGVRPRPGWPAIVLRTPKGWTGPDVVDGVQVQGTWRAHQVPLANVHDNPGHLARLEGWLRSYRPAELFDAQGRLVPELQVLAPKGAKRMGASPYANGGGAPRDLALPEFRRYAVEVPAPAAVRVENTRVLGELMRDTYRTNPDTFRLFCPDETTSNRLGAVFEATDRCFTGVVEPTDEHLSPGGRVMEVLSEHSCQGWLEGYTLTGRYGLFATYEAFAMVSASMTVQHAKWLDEATALPWRVPVPSLNILLTSTCWRNDHNGFSHQGPGLIDVVLSRKADVSRVYLPPDANCLLSVADHCLRSRDYVNLIVIDKQPHLQYLPMEEAARHCAAGAGVWAWAGNETDPGVEPDIVLACAGDVVTKETVAAAELLRRYCPQMRVRVVNVVDLMTLFPANDHPHGMREAAFVELYSRYTDVIFAFHGYPRGIHGLIHGQPDAERFHVRGYEEEGTTTTPFDMVVRNRVSRYHLCLEALKRAKRLPPGSDTLDRHCHDMLARHAAYVVEHGDDMPEVRDWVWTGG